MTIVSKAAAHQCIEIADGDSICRLVPNMGGSISAWAVAGQNMLRCTSDDEIASRSPLQLSSFPLVPYSNRIGYGRFPWKNETIQVTPNFAPEPHSIHGTGWQNIWHVEQKDANAVSLHYRHNGNADWPWSFDARQDIQVSADSLRMDLYATNLSDHAVPLAFGHHPYFDQSGAALEFSASKVWHNGDNGLPVHAMAPTGDFDFETAHQVMGRNVDHCFTGWNGEARIWWADRALQLKITSSLRAVVVYIPKGGDRFCFEPVPNVTNALNLAGEEPQLPLVEPGASVHSFVVLKAIPALV
jgi:aldose 1-epimerase